MGFKEWWEKESGWGDEIISQRILAELAWNKALDLAAKEVNKIAMHNKTIVCAVGVINRNRTDT